MSAIEQDVRALHEEIAALKDRIEDLAAQLHDCRRERDNLLRAISAAVHGLDKAAADNCDV